MSHRIVTTDAVIVGGGVAGLSSALSMSGEVALVSKSAFGSGGSTPWAQGGVAVALAKGDSPELHARDTLSVGGGLNNPHAVAVLTSEGPARIRELIKRGARFDRDGAGLVFGREAGHSLHRILHASGDATGAEIMRALTAAVRDRPSIDIHEFTNAVDLLVHDGRIAGLLAVDSSGELVQYVARAVVLATGGIGRLYARTTNPIEATGDGVAMAARAGARLLGLEFVQFHPTAMDSDLDPMPLITEALRGAGAVLVDEHGERYMTGVHPDAELAPRDVVARATWALIQRGQTPFIDGSAAVGGDFPDRFPTVFAAAEQAGFDPRIEPIPISPAAHYFMGGIDVDTHGRSSIPGLWAAGETAATGVHGANRLASNSLLEGLVFGSRVGASVSASVLPDPAKVPIPSVELAVDDAVEAAVRSIMWEHVGIARDEAGLSNAVRQLTELERSLGQRSGEIANMVLVARLIATAARARLESRGSHFRSDYPDPGVAIRDSYAGASMATVA
ncbi:MAG: L-aspartate oxidase [Acidimicrobiia bacterium]|nr:L-aspartate oxidase [Acidimicrobiia bacterium]